MAARKKLAGAAPPARYQCRTERVDEGQDNVTYRVWRIGERPRSAYSLWRPSDDDAAWKWRLAPGLKKESRDKALQVERIHSALWVVYGHNDFNTEKKPETRHKTKAEAIAVARERLGGCGYRDLTRATRRTKRK